MVSRPASTVSATLVTVGLAAFLTACGSSKPAAPPASSAPGKKVDAATAGTVSGKVVFQGAPPARDVIRMGVDQACVQGSGPNPQSDAVLIGADGALQNVFVYVKDGLDSSYSFDMPTTPVELDQKGCHYTPRILGVRAGQPLEIVNSDATLHNVHAMPMANQEFNMGQGVQGARMTKTFTVPEVMVRFKCDVHGWMASYVGVMANPFFAVTKADGTFEIAGLPPGTYTIGAWHERFGKQESKITIAEHQTQALAFSFTATK